MIWVAAAGQFTSGSVRAVPHHGGEASVKECKADDRSAGGLCYEPDCSTTPMRNPVDEFIRHSRLRRRTSPGIHGASHSSTKALEIPPLRFALRGFEFNPIKLHRVFLSGQVESQDAERAGGGKINTQLTPIAASDLERDGLGLVR